MQQNRAQPGAQPGAQSRTVYERIVFVSRLSAIGDVLIAMRAVNTLYKNNYFPIFITSFNTKEIVMESPYLHAFICFNKKQGAQFFIDKKEVDKANFSQYVKNLQTAKKPIFLDLQKTSRSGKAYSYIKKDLALYFEKKYVVQKRTFYRIMLVILAWLHFSQKKYSNLSKIKRIHDLQEDQIKKIVSNDKKIFAPLSKQSLLLNKQLSSHPKKYICIFPGASGFIKMWPKENFQSLITAVLQETSLDIFICGTGKTEGFLGEFLSAQKNERIINVVNKTTLTDILNLIASAKYVVTNDSFAAHAADAFCIPGTVIFGSTSPSFGFVPMFEHIFIAYENLACSPCTRHGKGKCRFENLKCLRNLGYKEILDKIIQYNPE